MKLGVVDDDLSLEHEAPAGHPERAERIAAVRRGIEQCGLERETLAPRDATDAELMAAHTAEHVEFVQQTRGGSGYIDPDTYYCPESSAVARRASGGCLQLLERLQTGSIDYGFAAVRPPGHHATRERAMGFCLFNHVAVAAAAALSQGHERVLIVDWDLHHGNGTEDIFYEDPRVLYLSMHQSPMFPGTGRVQDVGSGPGRGFNVNVPLSAGADDAVYLRTFEHLWCPIIEQFQPQFTLVSAGYDAHRFDPIGDMNVTDHGFATMTQLLLELLPERGRQGLLFSLEGGYDLRALESAVLATLNALITPHLEVRDIPKPTALASRYEAEMERARAEQSKYWRLD